MAAYDQMILDAFRSETYVNNRMDVQHTPIYDTITLSAAGSVSELTTAFFTNVGPASSKTKAHTNMSQSRRLPAPEAFSIFGFRLRWREDVHPTDLFEVLDKFVLQFYLGQKIYQEAPLWYFSPGGGVNAVVTLDGASTATTIDYFTNGVPHRESMHKLAIPIVIENQMTFWAQLSGGTYTLLAAASGGTGLQLQLVLDGFYARGVQ